MSEVSNQIDAETIKVVLENMKWWFGAFLLVAFIVLRVMKSYDRKVEKKIDSQKDQQKSTRAATFANALEGLGSAIRDSQKELSKDIHYAQEETYKRFHEVNDKIENLTRKTRGIMTFTESMGLIEAFFSNFTRFSVDTLKQSIKENNFSKFRDHIKVRVKTQLGQMLVQIRTELEQVRSFGINVEEFFVSYINMTSDDNIDVSDPSSSRLGRYDRFVLIERIWEKVEPYYKAQGSDTPEGAKIDLSHRLEAAEMTIRTEVADYLREITTSIKDRSIKDLKSTTLTHHKAAGLEAKEDDDTTKIISHTI